MKLNDPYLKALTREANQLQVECSNLKAENAKLRAALDVAQAAYNFYLDSRVGEGQF